MNSISGFNTEKGEVTIKPARKILLLSILALIVIGIAVLCITQWNNIQAAVIGLKYSQEEIDQMQTDAKTDFASKTGIDLDAVKEMATHIAPEETATEDENESESVESSASTANSPTVSHSSGKTETPTGSGKPADKTTGKPTTSKSSNEVQRDTSEVEAILARFYSMQSSYVSQIEGIRSSASAEYRALPQEEKGTEAIVRIGRSAIGRAAALESECDAKVSALLTELRGALQEAGLDQSLANEVKYYYASEKSLLKAQYMSKYKKYLS